ncbi:hypothetical protein IJT10_00150 [bacterium]|nr:hypothetical protein [bacterium]
MNDINGANSFSPCGCNNRYGLNNGQILFKSNNIPTDNQESESVDKVNIGDTFELNSQESVEFDRSASSVDFGNKDTLEKSVPSLNLKQSSFASFSLINSEKGVSFSDTGTIAIMDDYNISGDFVSANIDGNSVPDSIISEGVFYNNFNSAVNGLYDINGHKLA